MARLNSEKLLANWRWLFEARASLVARTAFGDLFFRDESGVVFWLRGDIGRLERIADSEAHFRESARSIECRERWFAESDERAAADRGLIPNSTQCITFKFPVVLAESGSGNEGFIADLYECVSFLGNLNRQISELPDGAKVRLVIGPNPTEAERS